MICGRTPEELIRDIQNFHGFSAPGLLIGAFMIDLAYQHLEKNVDICAVVETLHGLPDAVQLFTPCTIGNGRLKILDHGKFAMTIYDRSSSIGSRIWLDLSKTESYPLIYRWFMASAFQRRQSDEQVVRDIITSGHTLLSFRSVKVTRGKNRKKNKGIFVCVKCREPYCTAQGDLCISCQGKGYYQPSQTI